MEGMPWQKEVNSEPCAKGDDIEWMNEWMNGPLYFKLAQFT